MAGNTSGERHYGQHHPPRPPLQSQHSSSVPSTPSQHPRDLRFHSRSPSPNRTLGGQYKRSALSETAPIEQTSALNARRGAPVVCKFETGAEIRKRRIPYVEGGNEELGPPKKEPKKTLLPDEDDKLSGDMRELYDRLLPSEESEERRAGLVKKLDRILNDEWPDNGIRVNVFGSSGNLLSSSDSDVDICITTGLRISMHALATLLHRNGMEKVVCRASAKVPIVKCWDPQLQLATDLNVNNPLALENTRMIKTYVQLDDRIRPLAKIIKYWTKRRILNDAAFGGTISSYTWICMIINFLQRRKPRILPSLQRIEGKRRACGRSDAPDFADDVEALRGCGDANKESLAELLFQFFRHYGYEFKYSQYVVSIKEGRLLSRKEKGWEPSNYLDKEARNRLCVEEPFTTNRNLGNSADDYAWSGIHNEIRRACDLLAECKLEECCEEYVFPAEEKPIFQRPAPKPAPILRRSASQSGRPNHEPGSGRSNKGRNRNQSAQRAGSRRASSGASFSNQRLPLPFSPAVGTGASPIDYFGQKANLHETLYQQYQFLQMQQDALWSQLKHQQQQVGQGQAPPQQQGQPRVGDLNGSPHQRPFLNSLPSPRYHDQPPQTAPLLPGYLYHYPARYPPPSTMSQARSRAGTSTNPSSPSLVAAVPALRRQYHRASVPDGSSSSIRSQSQPGRSQPHPLMLQQQAHPGYDVSGAFPAPAQYANLRHAQMYGPGFPPLPFSPLTAFQPPSAESAVPKEYLGYYVGQSPSLGPQHAIAGQQQMPPMMLRDPPFQRPRRVTPDLMPPQLNGRHSSRSPSPLGHGRSYTTPADLRPTVQQSVVVQSPAVLDQMVTMLALAPSVAADTQLGGPLIVNGSNPTAGQLSPDRANGIAVKEQPSVHESDQMRVRTLPLRTTDLDKLSEPESALPLDRMPSSPRIDPSPRTKAGPRLSLSANGTAPHAVNGSLEKFPEPAPLSAAPLLSPVAELRTPSPTRVQAFEKQDSPARNGVVGKVANAASVKPTVQRKENGTPSTPVAVVNGRPERMSAAPIVTAAKPAVAPKGSAVTSAPRPVEKPAPTTSPTIASVATDTNSPLSAPPMINSASTSQNPWQQATRKGHRKSKSSVGASTRVGNGNTSMSLNGQPVPTDANERKGG